MTNYRMRAEGYNSVASAPDVDVPGVGRVSQAEIGAAIAAVDATWPGRPRDGAWQAVVVEQLKQTRARRR